ncbi:MAG: esterase, partial [Crocinitomicaceae bacterium]|nr:esterase [Crocinitomicaceae bacterium]
MAKWPLLLFHLCLASVVFAQCDGQRYRYRIFEEVEVASDVLYGSNIGASGVNEELFMDVYRPAGDTHTSRPVVVLAHGGFFLAGSKEGTDVVPLCEDLARMGYVAVSISYRLGIDDLFSLEVSLLEAVMRGVQDAKGAIRHLRKSHAEEGNPWGIDPSRVVLGGSSAGAFIALHSAYIDDLDEVPDAIDLTQPGLEGGLEGLSGSPGYSSEVLSIVNLCGAMGDAGWMEVGDAPVV